MRRRHDRRIPKVVKECDLWRTFAFVARLTSLSAPGEELPRTAFRQVLRNTLLRDLRRYIFDPRKAGDVAYALLSHPTLRAGFERIADSVNVPAASGATKTRKQQQAASAAAQAQAHTPERFAEILTLLDSPNYAPGLYDVRVLARFCRVSCAVIDADNMRRGVVWREGGRSPAAAKPAAHRSAITADTATTSSSSSSSSSSSAHNTASSPDGAPLLVLIYTPSLARFDVVMFHSARTKEDALLLYPDDPGYERELIDIAVSPDAVPQHK
jgi:hypothetical protein